MKALLTLTLFTLVSCQSTVTTTTTRTDGKSVTVVTEKKVDGNAVSNLSQLFVGGLLSVFGNKESQ